MGKHEAKANAAVKPHADTKPEAPVKPEAEAKAVAEPKPKPDRYAELVKEKISAGLPTAQAEQCAKAQLAHDEELKTAKA